MRDPLRHHRAHREKQPSRAERAAMAIAKGVGTVQFLAVALIVIGTWFAINGVVPFAEHTFQALGHGGQFDPSPWILLNLLFSFEAFFTGSLVIIAARASSIRDEEREEADAKHREEIAAEHSKILHELRELLDLAKPGGLTALQEHLDQRLDKLTKPVAPKRRTAK